MAKEWIIDDKMVRAAAREEILLRKEFYEKNLKGKRRKETLRRMEKITNEAEI